MTATRYMTKRKIVFVGNMTFFLSGQLLAFGLGLFYLGQEPAPFWWLVTCLVIVVATIIFTWSLLLLMAWWSHTEPVQKSEKAKRDAESYGKEADKIPGPVEPPA